MQPFYLGAWLAVDMCVGAIIMLVWRWVDSAECQLLSAAAASGGLGGEGHEDGAGCHGQYLL